MVTITKLSKKKTAESKPSKKKTKIPKKESRKATQVPKRKLKETNIPKKRKTEEIEEVPLKPPRKRTKTKEKEVSALQEKVSGIVQELKEWICNFALLSNDITDLSHLATMKAQLLTICNKYISQVPRIQIEPQKGAFQLSADIDQIRVEPLTTEQIEMKVRQQSVMDQRILLVSISLNDLKVFLPSVVYKYQTYFPGLKGMGTADVNLSEGEGISMKIEWSMTKANGRWSNFQLLKMKCILDKCNVAVTSADHSILDPLMASLFAKSIKRALAQAVVKQYVAKLLFLINSIREEDEEEGQILSALAESQLCTAPMETSSTSSFTWVQNLEVFDGTNEETSVLRKRVTQTYVESENEIEK